jgi:hypothetical protein
MAVLVALIYRLPSLAVEEPASFQDEVTRRLIVPRVMGLSLPGKVILAQLERLSLLFNRS